MVFWVVIPHRPRDRKIFPLKQGSVMPRFRLWQVSLCLAVSLLYFQQKTKLRPLQHIPRAQDT
jgi:hypothetical protein